MTDARPSLIEARARIEFLRPAAHILLSTDTNYGQLLTDALRIIDHAKRLELALTDMLDAGERDRAGFPIESEEWYARRDYARIQLEDANESAS